MPTPNSTLKIASVAMDVGIQKEGVPDGGMYTCTVDPATPREDLLSIWHLALRIIETGSGDR
jgi:hypothetical protein